MTKAEVKILDDMLEDLDNHYGNAGCNDMKLEDTPENRQIVELAEKDAGFVEKLSVSKGKILTTDFVILSYLRKRLLASV